MTSPGLDFDGAEVGYLELPQWREDQEILTRVRDCIAAERDRGQELASLGYEPCADAEKRVSPEALEQILAAGVEVHGIATEREVTNAITFNAPHVADAVQDRRVSRLRRALDRTIARKLQGVFASGQRVMVFNSGHFWYPPGSYMGWHTNSLHPGWRLYVTHAEEPGKSFFRYRPPGSDEIVTSVDREWDFRMFRISRQELLWHTVYSQTNRFSFGFIVRPWSLRAQLGAQLRRVRRRVGL
ncbi:MAG: hypothetical protein MJE66_09570 [Proteobacteria bacterium]|nr:hypothetical protein [Pseudomonadota bacterium]